MKDTEYQHYFFLYYFIKQYTRLTFAILILLFKQSVREKRLEYLFGSAVEDGIGVKRGD